MISRLMLKFYSGEIKGKNSTPYKGPYYITKKWTNGVATLSMGVKMDIVNINVLKP